MYLFVTRNCPRYTSISSLILTGHLKELPEYSLRHSVPVTAQMKPGLSPHLQVDSLHYQDPLREAHVQSKTERLCTDHRCLCTAISYPVPEP